MNDDTQEDRDGVKCSGDECSMDLTMTTTTTTNENEWLTATAKSSGGGGNKNAKNGKNGNEKSSGVVSSSPTLAAKNNPNNDYNAANVKLVRSLLDRQLKCLIILRGCSGSGKSTLAK